MNTGPETSSENMGGLEKTFEGVVFAETIRPGEYKSSSPDRKIMVLKPDSFVPEDGRPYKVRVIEDTKPENPMSGKYIVEIVLGEEEVEFLEKKGREHETIDIDEEGKRVRIGKEYTPIFEGAGERLSWNLDAKQFREEGKTMAEISFKRSDGMEIEPGGATHGKNRLSGYDRFLSLEKYVSLKKENARYLEAVDKLNSSDENEKKEAEEYLAEFKKKFPDSEWVLRSLRHLNGLAVSEANDILKCDPYFVESPYVVETMEKMTRLLNRQRERKQGIVILEGDAGTGKNKIVDHFAYLTNRPIFRFTCSAGKDEQDLKYLLEYDAKKGTYRIKSTVIEALETPGAILEFDEINTLKPEVAKILNSLLDHDRALFLGEDKTSVKASEEVLLVGLENPQHYMGVKPLAETIKSRARIMEVSYPPFEKKKETPNEKQQFRSDEAMIIRQHIPELKDLSEREFQALWDDIVNSKNIIDTRLAEALTVDRRNRILDIKEIVEIANKVREAYRAYYEGRLDDPIKFVFSLRESVEAAYELPYSDPTNDERNVGMTRAKKAVQEVVLPKIPLGEERTYLSTLIAEL